jgi:hypothetical protein
LTCWKGWINGQFEEIQAVDKDQLHVLPSGVLELIQSGDPSWPQLVPGRVAQLIKERKLFEDE